LFESSWELILGQPATRPFAVPFSHWIYPPVLGKLLDFHTVPTTDNGSQLFVMLWPLVLLLLVHHPGRCETLACSDWLRQGVSPSLSLARKSAPWSKSIRGYSGHVKRVCVLDDFAYLTDAPATSKNPSWFENDLGRIMKHVRPSDTTRKSCSLLKLGVHDAGRIQPASKTVPFGAEKDCHIFSTLSFSFAWWC
jgi:hypothetical protein